MKNIVFLGCENTHSATFLNFIKEDQRYSDIRVLGVYSHDSEAAQKLSERFSVPVLKDYAEAANEADGAVITARHGDNHYKYAKPYIKSGKTLFLDKPITIEEAEAVSLMRDCRSAGVKFCGGSSLKFDDWVMRLKQNSINRVGGDTIGGIVRCPIVLNSEHGGYFFYAQHLVDMVLEIFGHYPISVNAMLGGKNLTVSVKYDSFVVTGIYTDGIYKGYYAARITEDEVIGSQIVLDSQNQCFKREWEEFYCLLSGEQKEDCDNFIAPVFVMNAINRSITSGKEEKITYIKV